MKRLVALILTLALLTLTGCTSQMDQILGTWYAQVDIQQRMEQRLQRESPELAPLIAPGEFQVTVVLSFFADGTYQASIDPASVQAACQGYTARVEEGLWQYLQQLHAQQGLDVTLEAWLESLGITRQELMEEVIGTSLAQEVLLELGLREEGWFTLERGKLFFLEQAEQEPEDYHSIRFAEDTLTLSPGVYQKYSLRRYYEAHLPIIFHRNLEEVK